METINDCSNGADKALMKAPVYTMTQSGYCFGSDGNKVYYEVHGEQGPIIVLIYGVACLMNHWIYQTAELSKNYRVVLFDYRGHHRSENHPNLGMDFVANDIRCLLEHLNMPDAHLVGHSFGAPVLIRFAKHYPELTKKIVLINGFVYNPLDELFKLPVSEKLIKIIEGLNEQAPSLSQWLWKKAANNLISQIGAGLLGGFNLERSSFKDIEVYTKGLENLRLKVILAYMQELVQTDLREDLETLNSPALIISGLRDGITPTHQQDLMHALLPEAKIVKLPEGSHCTQLDLPEKVNSLMDTFFKGS